MIAVRRGALVDQGLQRRQVGLDHGQQLRIRRADIEKLLQQGDESEREH
jgi:hypothetical protein